MLSCMERGRSLVEGLETLGIAKSQDVPRLV